MAAETSRSGGTPLFPWGRWLALYCVLSFIMLGVDATMSHHDVLTENRWSWTPVIFAPLAVIVSLVSVFSLRWRLQAWILGALAMLVGIAGTLFHNVPTILERGGQSLWHAVLTAERPVFAPAAFAATGLLLLLIAWGERWQRRHTPAAREAKR